MGINHYTINEKVSKTRAAALEIELGEGDVPEQIENIRKFLRIQAKYDGSRLRDK